jgi:hypothetical protein
MGEPMLDELDQEIQELHNQLNPDSKAYRYDRVRLDVLNLRQDVVTLQEQMALAEIEMKSSEYRLQIQELKTSILETVLTHLCKPEQRNMLSMQVADAMLLKWQANIEKRLP